ncbi:shikimate dehydrogenase [soil metagenome]
MRPPTGSTQVAGVIGEPIAHSLSPAIHNAGFAALGLDWVFVALPTPAGQAPIALDGMRALGIRGLSVTMPHKAAVIPRLDELSPDALLLDAVNCITRDGDRLIGDSTDGAGCVAGLRTDFAFDPAGADCVVLGAGGAARSVVLALARAGARSVKVVNRTEARAQHAAALAGPVGSVAPVDAISDADLVLNATSVGMGGGDAADSYPCDPELLGRDQILAELIYHPAETALMRAAEARGARVANGLSMLVHQAAIAFETWTGSPAPLDAMAAAARRSLG